MKLIDTFRLSMRNLMNNFAHSMLAIVSITILFALIMTIANFCWVFSINTDKNIIESINQSGANLSVSVSQNSSVRIDNGDIDKLIKFAKNNSIDDYYRMSSDSKLASINEASIELKPYIGGLQSQSEYTIYEGEPWQIEDDNQDNIWLSKAHCNKLNVGIADTVSIKFRNQKDEIKYTIKGITNHYSYIDYRYFEATSITIGEYASSYSKMSELKQLQNEFEGLAFSSTDYTIYGSYEHPVRTIGGFVYGLCIALIAFSIGVSIVTLLNTLNISIKKNNETLGIMKSLGVKNRNMNQYITLQIGILLVIGTVFATIIASLIGFFAIGSSMEALMGLLFMEMQAVAVTTTFSFLLPLITLIAAGSIVFLSAIPMLRRYVKQDAIQIIKGGKV